MSAVSAFSASAGSGSSPGRGRSRGDLRDFFEAGVFAKITGDAILLAPPFVAEPSQIEQMIERIRGVLEGY